MIRRHLYTLALLVGSASFAQAAPLSALTFTGQIFSTATITSTRGYSFNVGNTGMVATHLSLWDRDGDGLDVAHEVGLWNPSGVLIASATIPAGVAAPLVDGFRIVDIPDVALPIGDGYVVGGLFVAPTLDNLAFGLTGIVTAPGITYVDGLYINNGIASLTLPTTSLGSGFPGGSLLVDTIAVPEPGTLALLGAGFACLLGARCRRRVAR